MTVIQKKLSNGDIVEFDSEQDTPDAIDRYMREYETRLQSQPGVPTGREDTGPVTIEGDTTQYDDWGTTIDKTVKTLARSLGSGWAQTGDLLATTGRSALDTAKAYAAPFMSEAPEYSKGGFITPVSDVYNRNVIPIPKGYEDLHSKGEIVMPALTGNIFSSLARLPATVASKGATKSVLGTAAKELAVKPVVRTAADVGLGYAGGEVGAEVSKSLGGNEDFGALIGSALLPGGAGAGTKYAANKALSGPRAKQTLDAIDAINQFLPPDKQIPPSMGLVMDKGVGLLEDVSGRGALSGRPAVKARRAQYTGIEEAKREAANRVRGGSATGPISELTIGRENVFMGKQAQQKIKARVSQIEEQLKADVGASTPMVYDDLFNEMEDIALNPDVDAEIKDHARTIMRKYARNVKTTQPVTGVGPPHVEPPTFGQVQGFRSRLGKTLHKGQPLDVGTRKRAYGATTEEMRQAAEAQGVTDFPARQSETERLSRLQEAVQPTAEATTAKGAYESVFGGPGKSDVEQFTPYTEFTPGTLAPIMANALELKLRGGQAGRAVNPESADMNLVLKNWRDMDEEFKNAYTKGDPITRKLLDDIATTAQAETVRPGKRTVPGATGSTIGASMELGRPAFWGSLALGGGGAAVDSWTGALPGAFAGAVITPALAYAAKRGLSGVMTDPNLTRGLVDPTYSLPGAAQHAVGGVTAEAAIREQQRKAEEEALRQRLLSGG